MTLVTLIGMHWQTTKPALARHIDTKRRKGWLLLHHFPAPTKEKRSNNNKKEEDRAHTEIGGTFQSLVAILVVRS